METDFKKKVFDENLFQFSLELLNLVEKLNTHSSVDLARKTVVDAFTTNHSLAELHTFVRTVNQLDLTYFAKYLPAFFENANLMKGHDPLLFDEYLMTLRHLAEQISFSAWEDLFKTLNALSSQTGTVLREFQMTIRQLSGVDFLKWEAFFKTTLSLSSQPENILNDYFMTVRHLTIPHYKFSNWDEFFKALTTASSKSEIILPFLTSVRHTLNYFKKPSTFESMMKTLISQSSQTPFEAYSYGQLESKKWLIEEVRRTRGTSWGTVFVLAGWIGSLAQLIFDSGDIQIEKIRSFDIDEASCKLAEKLNNAEVLNQWKFKAVNMDISQMSYPTTYFVKRHDGSLCELYDQPNLVINTSCEHIENLTEWWNRIPNGTPLVLQNNNAFHIADHINCVKSLEEFKIQLPLSKIDFAGELLLADYTRYMLIGEK
jgi:hypothetical protein